MKKNLFKKCLFIIALAVIFMVVISIMIKYEVEGEKVLPYSISKILLVSTVDGKDYEITSPDVIWNIGVTQVNDLYIYIDQTMETDAVIKEVKFENFRITESPQIGKLKVLRPTGEIKNLYTYSEQDYLNSSITYTGGVIDDLKSLEVSNVGGIVGFRFALEELGVFTSNENIEVTYDGKLLSNLGITIDQIKYKVAFDVIITTSENVSFKGTINLDMPVEDVIEKGSSSKEVTDFSNVVFKRV